MLELELTAARAMIESFAPAMEKRKGDGSKTPVAYLKISTNQDADVLAFFEPTLKAFYFNEAGPRDLANGLPLRDPHAVFPHSRDEEMGGAALSVDYGLGTMAFADAALDRFTLSPRDGGQVIVTFRARVFPDEAQAGKLYMLQEQEVRISVEPMQAPEFAES